jgi:hypothetical protein
MGFGGCKLSKRDKMAFVATFKEYPVELGGGLTRPLRILGHFSGIRPKSFGPEITTACMIPKSIARIISVPRPS